MPSVICFSWIKSNVTLWFSFNTFSSIACFICYSVTGWKLRRTMSPSSTLLLLLTGLATLSACPVCDVDVPSRSVPEPEPPGMLGNVTTLCPAGLYYDDRIRQCKPCQDDYFMTTSMAKSKKYSSCVPCYQPKDVIFFFLNLIVQHSITKLFSDVK